jgi:hypothetical protein
VWVLPGAGGAGMGGCVTRVTGRCTGRWNGRGNASPAAGNASRGTDKRGGNWCRRVGSNGNPRGLRSWCGKGSRSVLDAVVAVVGGEWRIADDRVQLFRDVELLRRANRSLKARVEAMSRAMVDLYNSLDLRQRQALQRGLDSGNGEDPFMLGPAGRLATEQLTSKQQEQVLEVARNSYLQGATSIPYALILDPQNLFVQLVTGAGRPELAICAWDLEGRPHQLISKGWRR